MWLHVIFIRFSLLHYFVICLNGRYWEKPKLYTYVHTYVSINMKGNICIKETKKNNLQIKTKSEIIWTGIIIIGNSIVVMRFLWQTPLENFCVLAAHINDTYLLSCCRYTVKGQNFMQEDAKWIWNEKCLSTLQT